MQLQLYVCGFNFGYYKHTYFLCVCIHIFSVVYHINYVSFIVQDQVIWQPVVFALISVISICGLFFFHIRAITFLLCWVSLFLDMWCYLHLMFVISKYVFFFVCFVPPPLHMRPVMFCCIVWHCGGFLTCVAVCPWCLRFQDVTYLCWDVALYLLFCWKWICVWSGWFSNYCYIVLICWCLAIQAG